MLHLALRRPPEDNSLKRCPNTFCERMETEDAVIDIRMMKSILYTESEVPNGRCMKGSVRLATDIRR
jgi:hypothetical protein